MAPSAPHADNNNQENAKKVSPKLSLRSLPLCTCMYYTSFPISFPINRPETEKDEQRGCAGEQCSHRTVAPIIVIPCLLCSDSPTGHIHMHACMCACVCVSVWDRCGFSGRRTRNVISSVSRHTYTRQEKVLSLANRIIRATQKIIRFYSSSWKTCFFLSTSTKEAHRIYRCFFRISPQMRFDSIRNYRRLGKNPTRWLV